MNNQRKRKVVRNDKITSPGIRRMADVIFGLMEYSRLGEDSRVSIVAAEAKRLRRLKRNQGVSK